MRMAARTLLIMEAHSRPFGRKGAIKSLKEEANGPNLDG